MRVRTQTALEEKTSFSASIFISHIGDEAPVAFKLKELLHEAFGGDMPIFVSSDYESIPTGDEWYRRIVDSIKSAKVVIVLLSKESVARPWINFEAGVGVGSSGKVLPIAIRGFGLSELKPPLQALHARDIHDPNSVRAVIRDIGNIIQTVSADIDAELFVASIYKAESRLAYKGILLTPFIGNRWQDALSVEFELANTGNQDLELIEVEVLIPEVLISSQALNIFDANYIDMTTVIVDDLRHRKFTYKVYEGAPNLTFGNTESLPRYFTRSMRPRVFRHFQTRIRSNLSEAEQSLVIRHQVYVREFNTEMRQLTVRDLLATPRPADR